MLQFSIFFFYISRNFWPSIFEFKMKWRLWRKLQKKKVLLSSWLLSINFFFISTFNIFFVRFMMGIFAFFFCLIKDLPNICWKEGFQHRKFRWTKFWSLSTQDLIFLWLGLKLAKKNYIEKFKNLKDSQKTTLSRENTVNFL